MYSFLFFVTAISILLRPVVSTCFLPNGTAHDDEGTQPCSFDTTNPLHNTCCHGKWDNAPGSDVRFGPTRDECLPNGLCQNRGFSTKPGQEAPLWKHFYRVYCTEQNWDACLSVCDTGFNANEAVQLTPCDGTAESEKWCCGDTTSCCSSANAHKAVIIPRILSKESLEASRKTSFKSYIDPNTYSRKRVNIGIGIGVGLGGPLLLAISVALTVYVMKKLHAPKDVGIVEVTQEHWKDAMYKIPERTVTELETPNGELQAGNERIRVNVELP